MSEDQPLFDSSRKALVFALNIDRCSITRPIMSRMMAEVVVKPKKKVVKKKRKTASDQPENKDVDGNMNTGVRPPSRKGFDAAGQAGLILQSLKRLDEVQVALLSGLLVIQKEPCSCGSQCCQGWRFSSIYSDALTSICSFVVRAGDPIQHNDEKRKLTIQAPLLRTLVEEYLLKEGKTLKQIAELGGVSLTTAAKHRDWVWTYLGQVEEEAWQLVDLIFDGAKITGSLA